MTTPQQQRQPLLVAPIYGALAFRQAQDRAVTPLLTAVRQALRVYGVPVTAGQRESLALLLWRRMFNARSRNYQAGVRYLHGQGVFTVPPQREYRVQAIEKLFDETVSRTLVAGEPVTERTRTQGVVVEQVGKAAARAASRHAQQPARETVKEVADKSGEQIGWARMLTGATSCAFCAMLASRGPVYKTDKTALFRGGSPADAYHDGCDCIAVLVRRGTPWEGQASHEALDNLWGQTGSLNSFRRAWDRKVRAGGTGEFIADTMKPPGGA